MEDLLCARHIISFEPHKNSLSPFLLSILQRRKLRYSVVSEFAHSDTVGRTAGV